MQLLEFMMVARQWFALCMVSSWQLIHCSMLFLSEQLLSNFCALLNAAQCMGAELRHSKTGVTMHFWLRID